jgi:hypothetical protein
MQHRAKAGRQVQPQREGRYVSTTSNQVAAQLPKLEQSQVWLLAPLLLTH